MAKPEESLDRATILGLGAMALATLIVANDFTALPVALPAIEADLDVDVTTAQWIVSGYALASGVLLITGGRLADMYGRRRMFFIGAATFATFSLLGGVASEAWMLLAARGFMGIGTALIWPSLMGLTYAITPADRAGLAGGIFLGAAGFGNVVGPALGGALTDALSWRWIFFINLPITAVAVFVTWWVVPADRPASADERIDYGGVVTLSVALLALLLALDMGADLGWTDPRILGLFVVFAGSLVAFVSIERRVKNALIPGDVLRSGLFRAACVAMFLVSAAYFVALMYLPQFMIKQLGYSAVGAGTGLFPMMLTFTCTSLVAGRLYGRLGPKIMCSSGALCLAVGMLLLSRVQPTTTYAELIPGMVVLGAGIGLFLSSITTAGVTALDPSRSSLASATVGSFRIVGGAIGLGLSTALVVTASSMVAGIGTAFLVNAGFAVAGLAISLLFVGGRIGKEQMALLHRHPPHG